MKDAIINFFTSVGLRLVRTCVYLLVLSIFYLGTWSLVHPTIYICKNSGNVHAMMRDSKFLTKGNNNITIVDNALLGDILWIRKYNEFTSLMEEGVIRGFQSVNHILGETKMSSKGKFTTMLRKTKKNRISSGLDWDNTFTHDDFYPASFKLVDPDQAYEFLQYVEKEETKRKKDTNCVSEGEQNEGEETCETPPPGWILKPVGGSGGDGIRVVNHEELQKIVGVLKKNRREGKRRLLRDELPFVDRSVDHFIMQKYISNPMLVHNRKFSIRMYWLVASLEPLRVLLFNDGRISTASLEYTNDPTSVSTAMIHLTNAVQQEEKRWKKNNPQEVLQNREKMKTYQWNFELFNKYLYEEGTFNETEGYDEETKKNWVEKIVMRDASKILEYVAKVLVENIDLEANYGLNFGLYGIDILIDDNYKVYLTEVQKGCGMKHKNPLKKKMKTSMLEEMFEIVYEIQKAKLKGEEPKELTKMDNFKWVINDAK